MSSSSAAPQATTTYISEESIFASRGNRGPITSVPVLPESCTETLTRKRTMGQALYMGHSNAQYFDPACFPGGTLKDAELSSTQWTFYYYSPALCPYGWTQAVTYPSSVYYTHANKTTTFVSIGSDTTVALCCPTGYTGGTRDDGHHHGCSSQGQVGETIPYFFPTTGSDGSWTADSVSTVTLHQTSGIIGHGVQIWWQEKDQEVLAAAASAASTIHLSSSTATSTPSRPQTGGPENTGASDGSESQNNNDNSDLSTGAQAGIGIGVALAMILLAALGFFLLRSRQRSRARGEGALGEEKGHSSELGVTEALSEAPPAQKYYEIAEPMPPELAGSGSVATAVRGEERPSELDSRPVRL